MDLRSLAGNFYEGAARCLELFEEEEVVDVLCEVCTSYPLTKPEGYRTGVIEILVGHIGLLIS